MTVETFAFGRVSLARANRHADALGARYLSLRERDELALLRAPKRRAERLAGRLAARRALARLGIRTPDLSVVTVPEGEAAGSPCVLGAGGRTLDVGLSISHGAGSAFAVASSTCDLGFDVERVEPRDAAFVEDAFEPFALGAFARLLGPNTPADILVTLAWCAKEACMKLARTGMRAPLRAFAPLEVAWTRPAPPASSGAVHRALRPAILVTRELGVVRAGLLARRDLAAALVWLER
ncbi:MAG TPA: 4'-phosphopantetheinyl transferase superfamily protein [Polyangiaceae bacterium]